MTPSQKLAKIARIYDSKRKLPNGMLISTNARLNLWGALIDLERTGGADKVCVGTNRRVMRQLAQIEQALALRK